MRVVPTDVVDDILARQSVEGDEACQRGTCSPQTATAGNLDALDCAALQHFSKYAHEFLLIGRQPEVAPPHPSAVPLEPGRLPALQIYPEFRRRTIGSRMAQPSPPDKAAGGQLHDSRSVHIPS
jgi:hypothetical protein